MRGLEGVSGYRDTLNLLVHLLVSVARGDPDRRMLGTSVFTDFRAFDACTSEIRLARLFLTIPMGERKKVP